MATILSNNQVTRIRDIQKQIKQICPNGWLCEGNDENCNQFFNNDTGAFFLADYNGKILYEEGNIPLEMRQVAKLEGQISKICEEK